MEEHVGQIWDRLITRAADRRHPEAAVTLEQASRCAGILFRALGGDGGLRVEAANATEHGARRSWLQRLGGSNRKVELAWRDEQALRLPSVIDVFPRAKLNRDLYLWLAALASQTGRENRSDWFLQSQFLTRQVLRDYPGLAARYRRLVAAHLEQRPEAARMPTDQAEQEQAICDALLRPCSRNWLPSARRAPQPVPLWLHPSPPLPESGSGDCDAEDAGERQGNSKDLDDRRRRAAERTEMPKQVRGLVTIRTENILTWGEFAKVDRGVEENEDLDQAAEAAEAMDKFDVTRDGKSVASLLRFDLDLTSQSFYD